jgi:hypothetical protein
VYRQRKRKEQTPKSIYLWGNNGGWSMMSLKALILYQCDRWVHAETSGVESKHIMSFISDNSTVIKGNDSLMPKSERFFQYL